MLQAKADDIGQYESYLFCHQPCLHQQKKTKSMSSDAPGIKTRSNHILNIK